MTVGFVHDPLAYHSFVECKVCGYEDKDLDVQHQCVINIHKKIDKIESIFEK